ncbi:MULTISPECIES: helix-turn-helix transcriptional regulator [unclassified Enterococcus]|uniref:helix-turn-helix transcriptional regulator n=1 Tax=unclassified Enterococcus TaxID=2608891 RepID=UPI0024757229|nr:MULTISPECIES: helix-turn-helix transcriptional regulator [unclassified Enterococcus]
MIVNKVQQFRKEKKLTQEEFAKRVGVSRKTIVSLEKGNYTPSLLLAFQIAKELEVEIRKVFELDEAIR